MTIEVLEVRLEDDQAMIVVNRKAFFEWLTGEAQRQRVAGDDTTQERVEGSGSNKPESEPEGELNSGVDLFEEKNGIGGELQHADGGRKKIKEIQDWLKKQKFSHKNFCLYLREQTEIAGWNLKAPLIGMTAKNEPSLFKLATRYFSFWKSQQELISKEYKQFLFAQVRDLGYTIEKAAEILEGEVIDPSELPRGTEVAV